MKDIVHGKVWKFLENVDTDQIIPAEYLVTGDPKELAKQPVQVVCGEYQQVCRHNFLPIRIIVSYTHEKFNRRYGQDMY